MSGQEMTLVQVYWRALSLLAPEKLLAIALASAGVVIAAIQLAEPILFGKVVDALTKGEGAFPSSACGRRSACSVSWRTSPLRSTPTGLRTAAASP